MVYSLKEIVDELHEEDTTTYEQIIKEINSSYKKNFEALSYLYSLDDLTINALTDNQLFLLSSMGYARGNTLCVWLNNNLLAGNSMYKKLVSIIKKGDLLHWSVVEGLTKEDLKFLTSYTVALWKKENPSRTYTKGSQFNFNMDMFSLEIFRNSITSTFDPTEAKNIILQINNGFSRSAKDDTSIKVRNKLYAIVLSNTPVHTKVLINSLSATALVYYTAPRTPPEYYQPDEDEALYFDISKQAHLRLASYLIDYAITSFSYDLLVGTHTKNSLLKEAREANRTATAVSILTSLAAITGNEAYTTLARNMISNVEGTVKEDILRQTLGVQILRNILQGNEDE